MKFYGFREREHFERHINSMILFLTIVQSEWML